jgi:anti-sigma B factor antagonist
MQALLMSMAVDGMLSLVLRGEINFTNAGELGDAIRAAVRREKPTAVRVDLAEVTFLDSSGIGVLVTAMRAADEADAAYLVENPSPNVFDQLQTTGLVEAFGLGRTMIDE